MRLQAAHHQSRANYTVSSRHYKAPLQLPWGTVYRISNSLKAPELPQNGPA